MVDKSLPSHRNGPKSVRSRPSLAKTKFSATTSNTADAVDDSLFCIDKVLYNLYGDMASALRNCEMNAMKDKPRPVLDGDFSFCSNVSSTSDDSKNLEERQNEAILECLKAFMSTQTNVFTEAVIDGLKERAVDLITLPTESHSSQINEIIPNENRTIENLDPRVLPTSQAAAMGTPEPSQRNKSFSDFAVPSNVGDVRTQLSVVPSSTKSFSQLSSRSVSVVYGTPQNSPFEFDASPKQATPQLDDYIWSNDFEDEEFAQPFKKNSNFRGDRLDFISPLSGASFSFQPSAMDDSGRYMPSERNHSLLSVSTQINPHLEFDSVRANRDDNNDGNSISRTCSNNSENKFAKPFKSIRSDPKVGKSNPTHSRAGEVRATPTTSERIRITGSPAASMVVSSGVGMNFSHSTSSNDANRQTQSKRRIEKQKRKSEFQARLAEFYESENFQRLHRMANNVSAASASKESTTSNEKARNENTERVIPSTASSSFNHDDNGNHSIAANASTDAMSGSLKDNASTSTSLSPFLDKCVLPPPPGF